MREEGRRRKEGGRRGEEERRQGELKQNAVVFTVQKTVGESTPPGVQEHKRGGGIINHKLG